MYTYIWEYYVRDEFVSEFEKIYGPDGAWAQLFRDDKGYIRTELHRDIDNENRYLTVDYWISKSACDEFQKKFPAEYKALDKICASLTEKENSLGSFHFV